MMKRFSRLGAALLLALPVLGGPWLFGAWEPWWFWPLAVPLFAAMVLFGIALLDAKPLLAGTSERLMRRDFDPLLLAAGVFLVYAAIRLLTTPVYTDAERSFLLILLPVLAAGITAFALGPRGRRFAFWLLALNALGLGLYGIVNHHLTGSERVMWMPGYMQYIADDRASGSYYCPNHYAGILELGAALAFGLLLDRGVKGWAKLLPLGLLAVTGVGMVLSKSRGGGLTLMAVFGCAALFGLVQFRPRFRWLLRGALLACALLLAAGAMWKASAYLERYKAIPWDDIRKSDRVVMIQGALRAWQTAPYFGIGPGMHQNLWPHFAASPDGDRDKGLWPSQPNLGWHSYEVHSDWVQLLEEYGAVGLFLFLILLYFGLRLLWRGLRKEEEAWRAAAWRAPPRGRFYGAILGGFLAAVAMILHQAVDFNLQMPATGWMLGAILGLAGGEALRADHDQ